MNHTVRFIKYESYYHKEGVEIDPITAEIRPYLRNIINLGLKT